MPKVPKLCLVSVLSAALALAASGEPVSAERARTAVSRWLTARTASHMRARLGKTVKAVRTVREGDADVFHVVRLEGGGFVIASADDRIEPIVAFSGTGALEESDGNPLWALLRRDMSGRLRAHRDGKATPRAAESLRGRGIRRLKTAPEEWQSLLSKSVASNGFGDIADVRVAPLLKTKWSQSGGSYNYYTPNGYPCGCVATAGAQLMRYHEYPTKNVAPQVFKCWVDGKAASFSLQGGRYAWDKMPDGWSSDEEAKEAVGRLCYDVGVASRMNWGRSGSGACESVLARSLVRAFGYKSAKCEQSYLLMTPNKFEDAIYANLDAGCPVILGIHEWGRTGGHCIVADGYGVDGGVIYTHLNLGWSGSSDAWYALPSVSTSSYDYNAVSSITYNVFPTADDELLTGRVLDRDGAPVSGARVTATAEKEDVSAVSGTTDENGIYALHVRGGLKWRVSASIGGTAAEGPSVRIGKSRSNWLLGVGASWFLYMPLTGSIGNSWGNDIVLADYRPSVPDVLPAEVKEEVAVTETIETTECPIDREEYVTSCTWLQDVYTNRFTVMCETKGGNGKRLCLQYWPENHPEAADTCKFSFRLALGAKYVARACVSVPGHAGETFCYRVLCDGEPLNRSDTVGTVKLWGGAGDGDFTAVVWGDNQCGAHDYDWDVDIYAVSRRAFEHMMTRQPDFGLSTGDMAAFARYFAEIKPLLLECTNPLLGRFIPYYVAWGNHDRQPIFGPITRSYFSLTPDPEYDKVIAQNYHLYRGDVLFVFIDFFCLETPTGQNKAKKWLAGLLSTERAQKAKFRIVLQHAPVHLETWGGLNARPQLRETFNEYGVDLVLSGHMHGCEHIERAGDTFIQLTNGGLGYLEHTAAEKADYGMETKLGGHRNIPYLWARQSAAHSGVLGEPQPVHKGCVNSYTELNVKDGRLTVTCHGFNADGSYIGIFDKFALSPRRPGQTGALTNEYPRVELAQGALKAPQELKREGLVTKAAWWLFETAALGRDVVAPLESEQTEPATGMSRREAEAYVRWLNDGKEVGNYRLPTADELGEWPDEAAPIAEWTSTDDETEGWCRIAGCAVRHIATPCCTANYLGFRVVKD